MNEQDQYKLQLAGFRMHAFEIAIKIAATSDETHDSDDIFTIYEDVLASLELPK